MCLHGVILLRSGSVMNSTRTMGESMRTKVLRKYAESSNVMPNTMVKMMAFRVLSFPDTRSQSFFLALALYMRSIFYDIALVPILGLIIYQHYIVKPDDPRSIKVSFRNSNTFIGFIFLAGVILSIAFGGY